MVDNCDYRRGGLDTYPKVVTGYGKLGFSGPLPGIYYLLLRIYVALVFLSAFMLGPVITEVTQIPFCSKNCCPSKNI